MAIMFVKREKDLIVGASGRPQSDMQEKIDSASEEFVAYQSKTGAYDKRTYSEKRLAEYPSLGDVVDAICKMNAGDSTEYDLLETKREVIKAKYPKE